MSLVEPPHDNGYIHYCQMDSSMMTKSSGLVHYGFMQKTNEELLSLFHKSRALLSMSDREFAAHCGIKYQHTRDWVRKEFFPAI